MTHSLRRLMETVVGPLPIENTHTEQPPENRIIEFSVLERSDLSLTTDHVCPQSVVVVELREDIPLPLGISLFHGESFLAAANLPAYHPLGYLDRSLLEGN